MSMNMNTARRCIPVLDKGYVTLVDSMGSDLTPVNAARVSFGTRSNKFTPRDRRLVNYLAKHKHHSPFRHQHLTFEMKAPEFVMRQAYKHVVGAETTSSSCTKDHAWNEISGRYVPVRDFYTPNIFRAQSDDNKQASEGTVADQEAAAQAWDEGFGVCMIAYKKLLDMGVAKEQARCILPLNQYTIVYWTASFQAVMNFIELRDKPDSQWEIQQYASAMRELVEESFPETYTAWIKCGEKTEEFKTIISFIEQCGEADSNSKQTMLQVLEENYPKVYSEWTKSHG